MLCDVGGLFLVWVGRGQPVQVVAWQGHVRLQGDVRGAGVVGEGDGALQQYGDQAVLVADRVGPVGGEAGEGVAGELPQATVVLWYGCGELSCQPGQPGSVGRDRDLDAGTARHGGRVAAELALPIGHRRVHRAQVATAVRGQRPVVEGDPGGDHLAVVRVQVAGEQVCVGEGEHFVAFAPLFSSGADLALEAFGHLAGVVQQRGGLHPGPEARLGGQDAG